MSTRSIETDAGPLAVADVTRETLEQLGTLFPKVGWIEHQGHRMLVLLPIDGSQVLQVVGGRAVQGYEDDFGAGATGVVLSFVGEICNAWNAAGRATLTITDLEPCPADWKGAHWRADVVLVDDKVLVIRPELVPEDPLLRALVAAGVTEVEHTPSVIVMQQPDESTAERDR